MLPERMQRDLAIVNDTQMHALLSYIRKYDKINRERVEFKPVPGSNWNRGYGVNSYDEIMEIEYKQMLIIEIMVIVIVSIDVVQWEVI